MKKKLALVVQRYGLEVNGGSELSCRLIAEKLKDTYEVEIITTKAIDYVTWENHYPNDIDFINGVVVRRFRTDVPRVQKQFASCNEQIFQKNDRNIYDELDWMKAQGPVSFSLLDYLSKNHKQYDKIIYFTYLYFTTYFGIQLAPGKSILVPTAHDEPYIYFSMFRSTFHLPKCILFLTEEEKDFVHHTFSNQYISHDVTGLGVEIPPQYVEEDKFRYEFGVEGPYIVYVGRIDESKGCVELFNYFSEYKKENGDVKLVLVGKSVIDIPRDPNIISLGFVSDEVKAAAMAYSKLVVMPSKFESFSMSVIEAMYLKKPVLVNGHSEVLRGHCKRGNAGLYYTNRAEFIYCADYLLNNPDIAERIGENGYEYATRNFDWAVIKQKFIDAIEN